MRIVSVISKTGRGFLESMQMNGVEAEKELAESNKRQYGNESKKNQTKQNPNLLLPSAVKASKQTNEQKPTTTKKSKLSTTNNTTSKYSV